MRRCTAPDGVFERALWYAPVPAHRKTLVESFVQHRIQAERRARKGKLEESGSSEVTIGEIYARFPTHVFDLPDAARGALAEAEFEAEKELCFANGEMRALYQDMRRRGLRTGFISDTYWSGAQLAHLLAACAPDVAFDFMYASCEFGRSKHQGLFQTYLHTQGLMPAACLHIGDNPLADIEAAKGAGITALHYPQATEALSRIFERENVALQMMRADNGAVSRRLDGGFNVIRRLAAGRMGDGDRPASDVAAVLGPILAAFHRLIENRLRGLAESGRDATVIFLARDAHLPLRVWEACGSGPAGYAELNRRLCRTGAAADHGGWQRWLAEFEGIDQKTADDLLKRHVPAIGRYFKDQPGGWAEGTAFARAFPGLVDADLLRELAASTRGDILGYLRRTIAGFDACTDIVLVDVGYAGSIQRALGAIFDSEGIGKRIHGVYLATIDEDFANLRAGDTVRSLISDTILTPMSKRVLLRNIRVVEQVFSAPVGAVRGYARDGLVREKDLRSPEQLELCARVQSACVAYVTAHRAVATEQGVDPLADPDLAGVRATAILSRFLLFPHSEETALFGALRHDYSVGEATAVELVERGRMASMLGTMPFPAMIGTTEVPIWLAGSLAAVSTMAGHAYALAGFGMMAADCFNDIALPSITGSIIRGGEGTPVPLNLSLTPFGQLRVRIPVPQGFGGSICALPLGGLVESGVIKSFTCQRGRNVAQVLASRDINPLPMTALQGLNALVDGPYFRATGPQAHLLVAAPPGDEPLSIITLTIDPLSSAKP
ncbi:MAG: HAD hydrolase-like protein [Magnetospirillum sp.]|nr:HAD hydrolase-like protein [Magnetospirillum sp.]